MGKPELLGKGFLTGTGSQTVPDQGIRIHEPVVGAT